MLQHIILDLFIGRPLCPVSVLPHPHQCLHVLLDFSELRDISSPHVLPIMFDCKTILSEEFSRWHQQLKQLAFIGNLAFLSSLFVFYTTLSLIQIHRHDNLNCRNNPWGIFYCIFILSTVLRSLSLQAFYKNRRIIKILHFPVCSMSIPYFYDTWFYIYIL